MANLGVTQYIGARYVPKFYENSDNTAEWRRGVEYEPLTIVTYNGNSYTSKKPVPANIGTPSESPAYWVATGNFNEQLAAIQEQMAELSVITDLVDWYTPEQYGAAADGTTDDSAAIQAAIDAAATDNKPIVLTGSYYIATGLRIYRDFTTFICTGFIYTNSDITVLTVSSNRNYIKINRFLNQSTNREGTGICVYKGENDGLGLVTSFNRFEINNIEHFNVGIICKALAGYGIQYNVFDFEYIFANTGIIYDVGDRGWVTQQAFYNGRLSGNIGFQVLENTDMDTSDNNVFYNVGFEDLQQAGMILFKVNSSFFDAIRMAENAESGYLIDMKQCCRNHFSGHIILPLGKVRDIETAANDYSINTRYNEFICSRIESDTGGWRGTHMLTYNGSKYIVDPSSLYYHITKIDTSYDFSNEEYLASGLEIWGGASATSGNVTYTLPWFYKIPGRYFVFKCQYKTGGATITIQTPNNQVILPDNKIEGGKAYIVFALGNTWHASEITL